jgi:hypothetical protein
VVFFTYDESIWFFSLLAVLGGFIYIYASLQEDIIIQESDTVVSISRELFFYLTLAILSLVNVLVFIFSKLYKKEKEEFLGWFYGQLTCLNIFFIIALSYVKLYNSNEKFDYDRIGFIIYGSVGLIVIWALVWPVYSLSRKFLNKSENKIPI